MKNIALVTTLFDYPATHLPCFYNNARKYFDENDIHIIRYFDESRRGLSLAEKLYHYKVIKNIEYYKEHFLGKYEYILFGDAKDTNFYREPNDIVDIFKSYSCNIVFCGEKWLWPPIQEKDLYNTKEKISDSFFLNSGLYFGYTDKIINHMEEIIKLNRTPYDDQGHWTLEYLYTNDIKVDQSNKLFFSTLDNKDIVKRENEKFIIDSAPIMVHDNGPFTENTLKIAHLL
jgi:hypothetical protein